MKVIDLLNKIANGEEVPEYISYYNKKESMSMIMLPCKDNIIYRLNEDAIDLGDEVEIPEEEKKIPEKITINENGTIGFPNGQWTARNMDKAFAMKINSIIDYLKSKGE